MFSPLVCYIPKLDPSFVLALLYDILVLCCAYLHPLHLRDQWQHSYCLQVRWSVGMKTTCTKKVLQQYYFRQ